MSVLAALCAPLHTRTAGSNRSSAGGARLRTPGPARLGCAPAPGARGQVGNMRTGGVRDFRKIFPVLLFSCRRGLRTRRPRLRRNRRQTEPRGRPRKFLKCVPGRSAARARQDGGGVLQAKDVQFLQRGRSEAHEGARSWKPHRVRGGDGGEGLRTPAASQSRRRRESGMTVSHEWLDKVLKREAPPPRRGGRGTGERDWAGEQETGRGAGGRETGERDLAGEQEPGRGAGDGEQENGIWLEIGRAHV